MIVRMWHGRVPVSKARAYREFTIARAIPDYQSVDGNLSVHVLERTEGDITHFITLTFWKDLDSIKGFAGDDVETSVTLTHGPLLDGLGPPERKKPD